MTHDKARHPTDELRDLIGPVRDGEDALHFIAALARAGLPGAALLVILDDERRLLDLLTVIDGAEHLAELVEFAWLYAEARYLFLAIDRTGQVPADRPDDELMWLELRALASLKELCLLDLFVVSGSHAFSVAEHAPLPAQW
jgi:hypothetical protein